MPLNIRHSPAPSAPLHRPRLQADSHHTLSSDASSRGNGGSLLEAAVERAVLAQGDEFLAFKTAQQPKRAGLAHDGDAPALSIEHKVRAAGRGARAAPRPQARPAPRLTLSRPWHQSRDWTAPALRCTLHAPPPKCPSFPTTLFLFGSE